MRGFVNTDEESNMEDNTSLAGILKNVISSVDINQQNNVQQGTPLVGVPDLFSTTFPLAIIARLFLIKENLTKERLADAFNDMASATGLLMTQASSGRGNLKKDIIKNKVSWDLLEKLIRVGGYDIVDVSLTLVDRKTHEVKEIKKSDRDQYANPTEFKSTLEVKKIE